MWKNWNVYSAVYMNHTFYLSNDLLKNPEGFGKIISAIVGVTITPDSPQEQTNREAECCWIAATKQKCAEIKIQSPARLQNVG